MHRLRVPFHCKLIGLPSGLFLAAQSPMHQLRFFPYRPLSQEYFLEQFGSPGVVSIRVCVIRAARALAHAPNSLNARVASLPHTMTTNARLTSKSDDALLHRMSRSFFVWPQPNCSSIDGVRVSLIFCFARSSFSMTELLTSHRQFQIFFSPPRTALRASSPNVSACPKRRSIFLLRSFWSHQ